MAKESYYAFFLSRLYRKIEVLSRFCLQKSIVTFFGYNSNLELQFRGRLDEFGKDRAPENARKELVEAMKLIAETRKGPVEQIPSMGCSIKWREET